MANTLKVTDKLAAVALDIFKGKSYVANNSDRTYEREFASGNMPVGDNVRVRIPSRFSLQSGNNRTTPQNIEQQSKNLSLTQNKYVHLGLNSQELAVFTGTDVKAQMELLEQPIANLARYVDTYCFGLMAAGAGSAVKKLSTSEVSYKDLSNMNARLGEQLAPEERFFVASASDLASIQQSQAALFNPSADVSKSFKNGVAGSGLGFGKWFNSQSTGAQKLGTATTYTTSAAVTTEGSYVIPVSSTTGVAYSGQSVQVSGVYALDPQTLTGIPRLATLVLAADVPASSTSITVVQPLYTIAGSLTLANVSALPASGATVTIVEAETSKSAYNLIGWTKKSFSLAFMDLPDDLPGAEASSISEDGVNIRIVRQFTGNSNQVQLYAETTFGGLVLRPEWIVKGAGIAV